MHVDVEELRDFYATPLGQVVRRLVAGRIRARWHGVKGETVVGLGFASPYLGAYRADARRVGALMPMGQGALVWPAAGPVRSVLVDEETLPLPDNSVDKLLAIHCLESASRPATLLRELWRVLVPQGSLLLVVPNRRGVWARLDRTPFGNGRPYSRGQIERLLADAMFSPVGSEYALHLPPVDRWRMLLASAATIERLGNRISPGFGGVILIEARKELVAPAGKVVRARAIGQLATMRGGYRIGASRSASEGTPPSRPEGSASTERS